jgi:TonB family protein
VDSNYNADKIETRITYMEQRIVWKVVFQGCSEETRAALGPALPISAGSAYSDELFRRAVEVTKAFDPSLDIQVKPTGTTREEYSRLPPFVQSKVGLPPEGPSVIVTICDPAGLPQRIRIDPSAQERMLLQKVVRAGAREGTVRVDVIVGKDGTVIDAKGADESAVEAVRQWKYRPTLLNGWPVEVATTVEV